MGLESLLVSLKSEVSRVSGVQASVHAGLDETSAEVAQVSGVSGAPRPALLKPAETPETATGVSAKAAPALACTPETPETPRSEDAQGARAPRTCTTCTHRLRAGTCAVPEQSGLIPAGSGFGIFWPPAAHAATCPAWCAKPTSATATRPYKLTAAQGDAAHAEPWDDGAITRFKARAADIQRRGFGEQDADDLAELLHLRDASGDHRHLCVECKHLAGTLTTGLRCRAGHPVGQDLATLLQRCVSFRTAHAAHQITPGSTNATAQVLAYPSGTLNAPGAKETTS